MTDELRDAARSHPFLLAVRDGTIGQDAFERWLVADARWVADLLTFQARLLARAPRHAQAVLADGLVALVAELDWFDGHLGKRGLAAAAEAAADAAPTTVAAVRADAAATYSAFVLALDGERVGRALTALWMIEQAYLDAWTVATPPSPGPFSAFAEHWTAPAFHDYVRRLRVLADPAGHADLVEAVLRHELAFWDAAWGHG